MYTNRWRALAAITIPLIMISIDGTILNVALPSIATALQTTSTQLVWINSGYIIVFGSTILLSGSLGDKLGRKWMLMAGMVIFILGSISSGLSTSPTALVISRMIQGLGGGIAAPATLSLITAIFLDPKERAHAIGIWAGFSGIGVAAGPILGGLLLTSFAWGSVFFVNVPIVVAGLLLIWLWVPNSKNEASPPVDWIGAVLSIIGLLSVFFFLIEGPALGWNNPVVLGSLIAGFVLLGAFIVFELRKKYPLLDPRLFKKAAFSSGVVAIMIAFFAFLGMMYEITLYLQSVRGLTPLVAGFTLVPLALVLLILASRVPGIAERFGDRETVVVGLLIIMVGSLIFALVGVSSTIWLVVIGLALLGAGIALAQVPSSDAIMGSVPVAEAGMGSSTNNAMRQIAASLGIAVVGGVGQVIYARQLQVSGVLQGMSEQQSAEAISSIEGAIATGSQSVISAANAAFVAGMRRGALLTAAVAVVGAIIAAFAIPKVVEKKSEGTRPMEDG